VEVDEVKVLVRGPLSTASGYGRDVVGLVLTMLEAGVDVYLRPTVVEAPLPGAVLALLGKEPLLEKYDAAVLYMDPVKLVGEIAEYRPVTRRLIGYTMWERTPVTWSALGLKEIGTVGGPRTFPFTGLDVLVVTCPMNVEAFRAVDPLVRIEVIPPGVRVDDIPQVDRRRHGDRADLTVFGAVGVMSPRKAPFDLLEAWKEFRERCPDIQARLEIKESGHSLHPGVAEIYPDLVLHSGVWPEKKLWSWMAELDVLVSASRGEGMNKPAVEFMVSGGPVIATGWGGHENWMRGDVGYPVKHRLEPSPFEDGTLDAPVDLMDMADQFFEACDRFERQDKGYAARMYASTALSWELATEKLLRLCGGQ
jgi:glycosyltransferase involved in cell wall biosynthesis